MDWQCSSFHRYGIHGFLWLTRVRGKAFQGMRYAVLMKLMGGAAALYNGEVTQFDSVDVGGANR